MATVTQSPLPWSQAELVATFVAALRLTDPTGQVRGAELAHRLLRCWSEPHRRYHAVPHLTATLAAVRELVTGDDVPLGRESVADVELAAWFHDAVYSGRPGQDEEASARLAETELTRLGLPAPRVAEVARLVRLTADHRPASEDLAGQVLCDADLSVLGAPEPVYRAYACAVRAEYAHVPASHFRAGRLAVLVALGETESLYRTERARRWWEAAARRNLAAELARLADPAAPLDGEEVTGPPATAPDR
jgi:predicted metal-dependent HD superfamily phosphohydrolase